MTDAKTERRYAGDDWFPEEHWWDDRTMFGTDDYSTPDTVRGADWKREDER